MDFVAPTTWADALAAVAAYPDGLPVAGGTDVMVEVNLHRRAPGMLIDLSRVSGLDGVSEGGGWLRIGATATFERLRSTLPVSSPALALAARTVGSPQIRNLGTIGGNLGTASPAGDALPPLLAAGAEVEVASAAGTRRIPAADFCTGPRRNALAPGELIAAVRVPRATGPQAFAKVGTRNAMVIAVCSLALALHPDRRRVGTGIGSAGPVPLAAGDAEAFLEGVLDSGGLWDAPEPLDGAVRDRFAGLVAAAATPIDDVRATAAYRRHALRVLAGRLLDRVWTEYLAAGRAGAGRAQAGPR